MNHILLLLHEKPQQQLLNLNPKKNIHLVSVFKKVTSSFGVWEAMGASTMQLHVMNLLATLFLSLW
jgi:hypothetical protein